MTSNAVLPAEKIEKAILLIRGEKVLLDRDLASLYGVSTSVLTKAVTRNVDRFPSDFMFQLTIEEFSDLKFHFGTSSWGGTRKRLAIDKSGRLNHNFFNNTRQASPLDAQPGGFFYA